MAFTGIPVVAGQWVDKWSFISQFWYALSERFRACDTYFPNQASSAYEYGFLHGLGTITGVTNDPTTGTCTVTDSTQSWSFTGTSSGDWFNRPGTSGAQPSSFSLIALHPDSRLVFSFPINLNNAATLTCTGNIQNYVNAKILPAFTTINDYVGVPYVIVRGDQGGLSAAGRFPEWPNDHEGAFGTGQALTVTIGGVTSYGFRDFSGVMWAANVMRGRQLVAFDSQGTIIRLAIISSDSDTVYFNKPPSTVKFLVDQVEAIPIVDSSGAGSFTLNFNSITTGGIVYTATPALLVGRIQSALDLAFGAGNFTASGATLAALQIEGTGGIYAGTPLTGHFASVITLTSGSFTINGVIGTSMSPGESTTTTPGLNVSSLYSVVDTDKICWPGRNKYSQKPFYSGVPQSFPSHDCDTDTSTGQALPQTNADWNDGFGTIHQNIQDIDFWTPTDITGGSAPDMPLNETVTKTFRFIQASVERICVQFVADVNGGPSGFRLYSVASLFQAAGINTIAIPAYLDAGGTVSATVEDGTILYYELRDKFNTAITAGTSQFSGGICTVPGYTDPSTGTSGVVTTYGSLGWTRYAQKGFRWFFDKTVYVCAETGGVNIIPPDDSDASHTGQMQFRAKSTKYKIRTQSFASVSGFSDEGNFGFTTGDKARYLGDNQGDPAWFGGDPLNTGIYADHLSQLQHIEPTQGNLNANLTGISTDSVPALGSTQYIRDTTQNFWESWYSGPATGYYVVTGTATVGGTNSMVDVTKSGNVFWDATKGFWKDFVLEVDKVSGMVTTTWKMPILSTTQTTGSISFIVPDGSLTILTGDTYRIRLAPELNRFLGRTITLTSPTGQKFTKTIAYNDNNTIWFTSPIDVPITAGWKYVISDPVEGTVWQWDGSKWIIPTSIPTTLTGDALVQRQKNILPDITKKYGRINVDDDESIVTYNEIAACIALLQHTTVALGWTNEAVSGTPENNYESGEGDNGIPGANSYATGVLELAWPAGDGTVYVDGNDSGSAILEPGVAGPLKRGFTGASPTGDPTNPLWSGSTGATSAYGYPTGSGVSLLIGLASALAYVYMNDSDPGTGNPIGVNIPWGSSPPYNPDAYNTYDFNTFLGGFRAWSNPTSSGIVAVDPGSNTGELQGSQCGDVAFPEIDTHPLDPSFGTTYTKSAYVWRAAWLLSWDFTY